MNSGPSSLAALSKILVERDSHFGFEGGCHASLLLVFFFDHFHFQGLFEPVFLFHHFLWFLGFHHDFVQDKGLHVVSLFGENNEVNPVVPVSASQVLEADFVEKALSVLYFRLGFSSEDGFPFSRNFYFVARQFASEGLETDFENFVVIHEFPLMVFQAN